MTAIRWSDAVEALDAEYALLDEIVVALDAPALLSPSGCAGWTNADLIFHTLLDAQRALVTFNSPAPGPATTNYVDYWRSFDAGDEGSRAHAEFVRGSVAAHGDPTRLAWRWHETAPAAVRAARGTQSTGFVTTQGYVLATADFTATLVVEAAVHHLDLIANLPDRPPPAAAAVAVTIATLDGLLGGPRPPAWDDSTYILKATGRAELTREERASLDDAAVRLPVFS
ncbi:MAG: maleylpyruvate isomerase N-terminal domain-containing protein [Actinomycetota bacterium]|nr:maleylpyruvate isomerase N-terminal domain-containing protein [Actinomycetota bacterium]